LFSEKSKIASACNSNSSFSPYPSSKLVSSTTLIRCDAPEDDPVIVSPALNVPVILYISNSFVTASHVLILAVAPLVPPVIVSLNE
jgi:hypothetical protein